MTAYSTLFGSSASGSGVPYPSNVPHILRNPNNWAGASSTADRDWLVPFVARADVTIDEVWWQRVNTNAANVYVGIYSGAGSLLTDCAVDSDTTAGYHAVSTTGASLTAGSLYYWAINVSSAVAVADGITTADGEYTGNMSRQIFDDGYDISVLSALPVAQNRVGAIYKARSNAALPSSQTMTGWTGDSTVFLGGFVPQ